MSVIITLPGGAQSDWNATSGESQILNKPTLGTAAGADIEDFVAAATIANYETITQLNARDTANRNRANHTGTQLASTISDLGSAISANTDVALNTAARHAAVTVTDSSEIDFTLTGQNITASLINGSIGATRLSAGVNTSLGLANSALQPSTIGVTVQGYSAVLAGISQGNDGQIINGVAYFVRTTKPTTRIDGSALVAGDRWYKTDDGTEWYWNGTYWLSTYEYATVDRAASAGTTDVASSVNVISYNSPVELVFVTYVWAYRIPGGFDLNTGDVSNHFVFRWGYHSPTTSLTAIVSRPSYLLPNAAYYREEVNTAFTITGFTMSRGLVGAGASPGHRMGLNYRKIAP